MTPTHDRGPDRLLALLPAYYRQLDAEAGGPLAALLRPVAGQVTAVEDEIGQSYDDLFIETCRPWVAPYLGDLVGYEAAADPLLSPRADVANAVALRRKKGTLGVLEDLAAAVAGWPAVAIELADRVGRFVAVRELTGPPRPGGGFATVRDAAARVRRGTPFDRAARFAEVRRVNSRLTPGRADPAGVAVYVYRLRAAPVVGGMAFPVDAAKGRYTFDPLGADVPLYHRADEDSGRDDPLGVPAPIPRAALPPQPGAEPAADDPFARLYARPPVAGAGRDRFDPDPRASLAIFLPKVPPGTASQKQGVEADDPPVEWDLVPADRVYGADLGRDGKGRPVPPDAVAVDPVRGRLTLGRNLAERASSRGVRVTYHHGTADAIGAGGHPWDDANAPTTGGVHHSYDPAADPDFFGWLQGLIAAWPDADDVSVEVPTSATINVTVDARVGPVPVGKTLRITAGRVAERDTTHRPVFRNGTGKPVAVEFALSTHGGAGVVGGRLALDGLTFAGVEVRVAGGSADPGKGAAAPAVPAAEVAAELDLRRVTIVPPPEPTPGAAPVRPGLTVHDLPVRAAVRESVLGPVQVDRGGRPGAPVRLDVADSILDAGCPRRLVLAGPNGCHAPAEVTVRRCTVRGRVRVHALVMAADAIFLGPVHVARRQCGGMRYSYYRPTGADADDRTPRRVWCQPESAAAAARACGRPAPAAVAPVFTTTVFGRPGYFQLAPGTPAVVTAGAEDEGEMGAYHRLRQYRRAARLRGRLGEFAPTGFEVELIHAT